MRVLRAPEVPAYFYAHDGVQYRPDADGYIRDVRQQDWENLRALGCVEVDLPDDTPPPASGAATSQVQVLPDPAPAPEDSPDGSQPT